MEAANALPASSRIRVNSMISPFAQTDCSPSVCQLHLPVSQLASPVIPEYNTSMKTAISIPDDVFESADQLAERLGVSRSWLYSSAVAEYVAKHQNAKVTARLNAVYANQPSQLDPAVRNAQRRSARRAEW